MSLCEVQEMSFGALGIPHITTSRPFLTMINCSYRNTRRWLSDEKSVSKAERLLIRWTLFTGQGSNHPIQFTAGYDEEAQYFEAGVRQGKRQELLSRASAALKPGFDSQIELLQQRCLTVAKEAMAQAESDSSQFLRLAKQ